MIIPVANKIYRGPEPTLVDYPELKANNIVNVVNLEGAKEEKKEAIALAPMGIAVYSFPISTLQIILTGISQDYLEEILKAIETLPKPMFVHCVEGHDRTGLLMACYRVRNCGFSKEQAFAEALQMGYKYWKNWGLNRTWDKFPILKTQC